MEGLCSMKQSVRLFLSAGCFFFPKTILSCFMTQYQPSSIPAKLQNSQNVHVHRHSNHNIRDRPQYTEHPFSCSFLDDCLSLFLASCLHVSWFSLTICFFCRKWTYGWNLSGHHHITRYWLRTWTRHVQAYQRGNRHKYETICLIAL